MFVQLEPGAALPPPCLLKRKILIKNKRLKPEVEKQELELFKQGQFVIEDEEKEDASAPIPEKKVRVNKLLFIFSKIKQTIRLQPEEEVAIPTEGADADVAPTIQYTGSTTNVHPWLSSMVNYAQPVKFQGFDVAERK